MEQICEPTFYKKIMEACEEFDDSVDVMSVENMESTDGPKMNLSLVAYRHFFWVYLDRNIDRSSLNKWKITENFISTFKCSRPVKDYL